MTLSETKDLLIGRIGWRDDKTVEGLVLSAANLESNSGKFYQAEHSAVTLANIRDCQPIINISANDFNDYLSNLTEQCVIQVLENVFEGDYVSNKLLTLYPTAFDQAISLRMVILVSELIMTSTRMNKIKRFTDEFVGKLNYDVFREAPNKFAIRGANYIHTLGIASRYGHALRGVQKRFGTQKNSLRTITTGQAVPTIESLLDEPPFH